MKNLIIFIIIYTIGTINVFAQSETDNVKTKNNFFRFNTKEKVSYEIRAGVNFSSLYDIPTVGFAGKKMRSGGILGLLIDLPFLENVYFQTGLLFFSGKNVDIYNLSGLNFAVGEKYIFGFEHPFLISYRQDITKHLKWDLNLGMYFQGDANFSYGAIGGTGLHYNRWYCGIQYKLIEKIINPNPSNVKNNIMSIAIGYKL